MDKSLSARMDDLSAMAHRGELAVSDFLSPADRISATHYLCASGAHVLTYGGYSDAERQRIYILPDYMEGVENIDGLAEFGADSEISVLSVTPSGFSRALTHRDFLGAVLNTGIERAVVGDILVDGNKGAFVFCKSSIEPFLLSELSRVANDKVTVKDVPMDSLVLPERKFADINDTVASPRLDCVVGSLCNLSRDKARTAVESGLVELDFCVVERADKEVREGVLVSVRGYGRYRVLALGDKTRKGRYKLLAQKYL